MSRKDRLRPITPRKAFYVHCLFFFLAFENYFETIIKKGMQKDVNKIKLTKLSSKIYERVQSLDFTSLLLSIIPSENKTEDIKISKHKVKK